MFREAALFDFDLHSTLNIFAIRPTPGGPGFSFAFSDKVQFLDTVRFPSIYTRHFRTSDATCDLSLAQLS
jgi:hypothetical protein